MWLTAAVSVVVRLQAIGSAHLEARFGDLGGMLLAGAGGQVTAVPPRDSPESLVRQRFDDRNIPPGI